MSTVFCLPGIGLEKGDSTVFVPLVNHIKKECPASIVFSIEYDNSLNGKIEEISAHVIKEINLKLSNPAQPVVLIGYSYGGVVALMVSLLKKELNVRKVCTIASPVRGTTLANSLFALPGLKESIGVNSRVIREINVELGKELNIQNPLDPIQGGEEENIVEGTMALAGLFFKTFADRNTRASHLSGWIQHALDQGTKEEVFDNLKKRKAPDTEDKAVKKKKFFMAGGKGDQVVDHTNAVPENIRSSTHVDVTHYVEPSDREHFHLLSSVELVKNIFEFIKDELPGSLSLDAQSLEETHPLAQDASRLVNELYDRFFFK